MAVREAEFVAGNDASLRFQLRRPLVIYSLCDLNGLLPRRAQRAGAEGPADAPTRCLPSRNRLSGIVFGLFRPVDLFPSPGVQ